MLYAIVTEFIDQNRETAIFAITVDLATGKAENISETFVYNGGSATVDGISGLDQTTGVYWYTTDYADKYAYSVNVYTKSILPPLDINANFIHSFRPASMSNMCYILADISNQNYLLSVSEGDDTVNVVSLVPSNINLNYIAGTAIDESTSTYYLVASTNRSTDYPNYKVFSINLHTGKITTLGTLQNCSTFPAYIAFEQNSKQLIGVIEDFTKGLVYYYVQIDPESGKCKSQLIKTTGIVTCVTFSQQNLKLYVHEATGAGGVLHSIDVETGTEGKTVVVSNYYILESMEISA